MMSAPAIAKKRRLSTVAPKGKNGAPASPASPLPANNDAAEKRAKALKSRAKPSAANDEENQRAVALATGNQPISNKLVGGAVGAAPLDNQALADLYATCINMSTQNVRPLLFFPVSRLLTAIFRFFFLNLFVQKINQKNAWSLNLIEHIDDVLEADERAAANRSELVTTNFQKASCTVETSVKIYCYRVDAVHSETFKMLGGLTRAEADAESDADDDDNGDKNGADDNNGAGDAGEPQFDDDGNPIAQVKKIVKRGRKDGRQAGAATLESNVDALDIKAGAETVLSVDPLFRKTSAKFDQGGTRGLLLNHLQLTPSMQLLFDSSMPVVEPLQAPNAAAAVAAVEEDDAEIDDDALAGLLSMASVRAHATLCPSFQHWSWDDDTSVAVGKHAAKSAAAHAADKKTDLFGGNWDSTAADVDAVELEHDMPPTAQPMHYDDVNNNDGDDNNDAGGADFGGFDAGGFEDDDAPLLHGAENEAAGRSIAAAIVQRPELVARTDAAFMAGDAPVNGGMALVANMLGAASQQNDYQFFDAAQLKNWAGPAHWKFSKAPPRAAAPAATATAAAVEGKSAAAMAMGVAAAIDGGGDGDDDENGDDDAAAAKRKRSRVAKTKTLIDFANPPEVDFDKAFKTVPVTQTTLTATMRARLAEQPTTLPPDLHFDARSLTALFNKPKWSVVPADKRRRLSTAPLDDDVDNGVGGAAARDAAQMLGDARFDDYDDNDFDGGGFDGAGMDDAPMPLAAAHAGLDLVASPLKPQKYTIGFQRKAKRVDVRLLKRSIWQELSRKLGVDADDDVDDEPDEQPAADDDKGRAVADDVRVGAASRKMQETRDFREILDVIPTRPDAAKVGEISVPLSFICLLHLCNEKRLTLEPTGDGSLMVRPPSN